MSAYSGNPLAFVLAIALGTVLTIAAVAGLLVVAKRRRRSRFAEYGFDIRTFELSEDGTVQYAQWLHPKDTAKHILQADVTGWRRFIKPGDTVIDIGAHTGDTTIPFALAAGPTGLTLALEPNPYVFKILEQNARLNRRKTNIVPLNYAATETDGTFTFHYSDGAYCNGGFLDQLKQRGRGHRQPLDVQGRNLEVLLRRDYRQRLSRLSVVKIDTEGYDRQVIQSILKLLVEFQPVVMCEVYRHLTQPEREQQFDVLAKAGYACHEIASAGDLVGPSIERTDLMRQPHFDMIALPRRLRKAAA